MPQTPQELYVACLKASGHAYRVVRHGQLDAVVCEAVDAAVMFDLDGKMVAVDRSGVWGWTPEELTAKMQTLEPGAEVTLEKIDSEAAYFLVVQNGNHYPFVKLTPKLMRETPESRAAEDREFRRAAAADLARMEASERRRDKDHALLTPEQRRKYDRLPSDLRAEMMRRLGHQPCEV